MNLIWHIVRKDFRRLRLPLALWLVFMVLQMVWMLDDFSRTGAGFPGFERVKNLSIIWSMIGACVGFVMAAWLVMEDNLVSTQVFWRTRPISRYRLLVAKLVGAILLLGFMPALALAPFWLWCGFSGRELLLATAELVIGQGVFSVIAFAVAGVTENASQFIVRFIVVAVLAPLSLAYCLGVFMGPLVAIGDGLAQSRYWLVLGLFALTPVAMVAHQYLTLRESRSYALLVAGISLMFAARLVWPWDVSSGFLDYPEEHAAMAPVIGFGSPSATVSDQTDKSKRTKIVLDGTMSGAPTGSYIRFDSVRCWWIDAAGRRPGARLTTDTDANFHGPPEKAVLQVTGLRAETDKNVAWNAVGSEPAGFRQQVRGRSMQLKAAITATVMRGEILGRLPLRVGAVLEVDGSRTRVIELERHAQRLVVWLDERDPWPIWWSSRLFPDGKMAPPWKRSAPQDSFLLLNPATEQEVFLGEGSVQAMRLNSTALRRRRLTIALPMREIDGRMEETPGWEETAVLVKVRFSPAQKLTRLLSADLTTLQTP